MVPVNWRIFLSLTSQALSPTLHKLAHSTSPINMSTTSTATASVEMDPTLGNNTKIANQFCIMVTTQGDGTPLGPTSFGEGMIELCIGFGQEYPAGVLQLSDTETVLAFLSDSNLMVTWHCFAVATVWHGKPVKLCIQSLMSAQVRNYIAARSNHPLMCKHLSRVGRWRPSLSPASPT